MTTQHELDETRAQAFRIIKEKSFALRDITLASGAKSGHYFDMKPSMMDPVGARVLSELILAQISGMDVDYIGGIEMGAVPLVASIALTSGLQGRPIPGFFVRKTIKEHGTRKEIEGVDDLAGKNVVVVEDVTTTGKSAMISIDALRHAGANIKSVISIVDREAGATELYKAENLRFEPLFTASEFL